MDQVDRQIRAALPTEGEEEALAERDDARRWLRDHADRAYPRVRALAQATPDDEGLIELLGLFRRAESTPFLTATLRGGGEAARQAGVALGLSPDPAAHEVLAQALTSSENTVVKGGLDGLRARGDATDCPLILPLARHPDPEIRGLAALVADALSCPAS